MNYVVRTLKLSSIVCFCLLLYPQLGLAERPEASLPEAPEAATINPCEQYSLTDLAGQVANQKHDGKRFYFNPANMQWDASREIWYDDQGGSTWECQMNSNATGNPGLVYDFNYRRSGASSGDMYGRLDFGNTFMDTYENQNTCFICGLIRHKKGCFPPGVKITLADGTSSKLVEEVGVGDMLWNPKRKAAVKVLKVIEGPEKNPLVKFSAGELSITVSDQHPMLTADGLKMAKEVTTDDFFFDAEGNKQQVSAIEKLPVKVGQTVINFELEDDGEADSRYILADGVIVGDLVVQTELSSQ